MKKIHALRRNPSILLSVIDPKRKLLIIYYLKHLSFHEREEIEGKYLVSRNIWSGLKYVYCIYHSKLPTLTKKKPCDNMYILKLLNHDNSNKPALSHPQGLTLSYIPTPPPHSHTQRLHICTCLMKYDLQCWMKQIRK